MEFEIDDLCNKIYGDLFETNSELVNIDIDQNSLSKCCNDFQKTWNIVINSQSLTEISVEKIMSEFEILKQKIIRKTKKCVVFGRTSAGKSTFINALLTETVLPESFGSTSNCFVIIQASPDDSNYIVVDGNRRQMNELESLNNFHSPDKLEDGSIINLFYNRQKCQLLSEDVVLIDTPGLDADFELDTSVEEHCVDADLIILIVNAQCGLSRTESSIFNRFRNIFSASNVMIVFNFWDVVSKTPSADAVRNQQSEKAKRLLCEELSYSESKADANIYFISAAEREGIFSNNIAVNLGRDWDLRNETFANLFNNLKKEMAEKSLIRRHDYLSSLLSSVSSTFRLCQSSICQMREKRIELSIKLKSELSDLTDINEKINAHTALIFNEAYEELMLKGLEISKMDLKAEVDRKRETEMEFHNIGYMINEEDVMFHKLEELLNDIIEKALIKLKNKIIEFVAHDEEDRFLLRSNIMTELYFPFHLDLKNEINFFDLRSFQKNLMEISRRIKIGTRVTIGLTAGAAAAGLATGGAAFAIVGIFEFAAAAVAGIAGAGAAAGAGVGFGAAFGAIKNVKMPFQFTWKKYELNIKGIWSSFESILSNSYLAFLDDLISNITQSISLIEEKSIRIQNNLNHIKEDLMNLKNYSLIV